MPQDGFEDGFLEIAQEQLDRLRKRVAELDEQIREAQSERDQASKRIAQLEGLVGGSDLGPGKPFADADAVVNLIRERGQRMHYIEIYNELKRRGFQIGGQGNADTLLSRYHNDPRLKRVSRGTYDLVARSPRPPKPTPIGPDGNAELWYLEARDGISATGKFEAGGLRVLAGSKARKQHSESFQTSSKKSLYRREQLIREGAFVDRGSHYELQRDTYFENPSHAANVMRGVPLNGWVVWKNAAGQTLDDVHRQ